MGNSKQNLPSPAKLSKNYSGSSSIYTPKQLVSLVVEGVDHLLKLKFGVKKGIISEKVAILDPAVGMLAFPLGCLNFAHKTMKKKDFDKWVKNAFVGKYFCFEVNKLTVKKAKKLLKKTLENAPILNKLQGVDSKKLVSNFEIHLGNTLSSPNPKEKTNEEKQFLYLRRNLPFTESDKL